MMTAYQQTAALHAAIELNLFTAIADGHATVAQLAAHCRTSERGLRILADYWTVHGLLIKQQGQYSLAPESATFLNRHSPAYLGAMSGFLAGPHIRRQFDALPDAVRKGGVAVDDSGSTASHYEGWIDFANSMTAMMGPAATQIAQIVNEPRHAPLTVLDVAASHGLFGFTIAQQNPRARITALDWPIVLEITKANAERLGLSSRLSTIAGDAFTVDLGGPYDVILLTNLLHHFDHAANVRLLKRMKAALKPNGRVFTLEFVPNDDRVSPPSPASFALVMLASTPAGDAFTFGEFARMFNEAGFSSNTFIPLDGTPEALILSQ
jgi:ubiquinone/menaquinone biosynthesis C-methylase UbiE